MKMEKRVAKKNKKKGDESINDSHSESGDSSNINSEEDDDYVPEEYIFPSFMAFVLWGPFAIDSEKLSLFCTDDAAKSTVASRAQKRKMALQLKKEERAGDRSAVRGFSTEQRINLEALDISKQKLQHQKNQSFLVSLAIQESAMARSIEALEKRAMIRCPEYDENNIHWKKADELSEEHQLLVKSIGEKTEKMFSSSKEVEDIEESVGNLKRESSPPLKKQKKCTKEDNEVEVVDDSDDSDFVKQLLNDPICIDNSEDVEGLKSIEKESLDEEMKKDKKTVTSKTKAKVSTFVKRKSSRSKGGKKF